MGLTTEKVGELLSNVHRGGEGIFLHGSLLWQATENVSEATIVGFGPTGFARALSVEDYEAIWPDIFDMAEMMGVPTVQAARTCYHAIFEDIGLWTYLVHTL